MHSFSHGNKSTLNWIETEREWKKGKEREGDVGRETEKKENEREGDVGGETEKKEKCVCACVCERERARESTSIRERGELHRDFIRAQLRDTLESKQAFSICKRLFPRLFLSPSSSCSASVFSVSPHELDFNTVKPHGIRRRTGLVSCWIKSIVQSDERHGQTLRAEVRWPMTPLICAYKLSAFINHTTGQ